MNVYLLDVSPLSDEELFKKHYDKCSDFRKKKIDAITRAESRRLSLGAEIVVAHGMKKRGIASYEISVSENGKPFVKNCNLHFNLSHSGKFSAAVFSDTAVGIDIETPRKVNLALASRHFSAAEQEYLKASSCAEKDFLRIWTRKESLAKACGLGLCAPLCDICTISDIVFINGERFNLFSICDDEYTLSVAFQGEKREVFPERVLIV